MRTVELKALKNKLGDYVRRAAMGETVLVTIRGRVVAELVPPRSERSARVAKESLAQAARQGWITPPALPKGDPPPSIPVAPFPTLLREHSADRDDR